MDLAKLKETLAAATKGPWFVSGARVKLARQDTHAICHYEADVKRDENIANVWYNPRTNAGRADAALIAMAPDLAAEVLRLAAERDAAVAANAAMMVRENEARAEADLLMAGAVEFCRRVDAGEIRSKRTYAAFAAIIEKRLAGKAGA